MFKDYNKEDFCSPDTENAFAIELEVSVEDGDLHDDYKHESDKIVEFLGVHNLSTKGRLSLLDEVKDTYKDKFPVGQDNWYISWGVHFLLFGDFRDLEWKCSKILGNNLLNCPLYCKIDKNSKFYTRYLRDYCTFSNILDGSSLGCDSKGAPVTFKRLLYSNWGGKKWIEFRLNNVVDDRILWYYQAQTILFKNNIELEKIWDDNYFKIGERKSFYWEDYAKLSELEGRKLSSKTKKILQRNLKTIFNTLEENNLSESRKQLEDYCNEYNLLDEEPKTF